MKKILSLLLIVALCFALTPSRASAAVKISKKSITLDEGKTTALKITGTKQTVKWTSSNNKVATVTSKGKVTAIAEGSATITATISKKKYTCKVSVTAEDYSDWALFRTDDFDFARDGMLEGEIVYYDEDYYLVSPKYFSEVIEPDLEYLKSLESIGGYSRRNDDILTPDGNYIIDDDAEKIEADESELLMKRINEIIKAEIDNSEKGLAE